jgi:hypothetical protein
MYGGFPDPPPKAAAVQDSAGRAAPPGQAAYDRAKPVPAKPPEKRSRKAHPPPEHAKPPPAPSPRSAPKTKEKESPPLVIPESPGYSFDFRKVPGCFDIVGRGSFPAISFSERPG